MVCQICGIKSGIYPLCKTHYRGYWKGEVEQCKRCKKWKLKGKDCTRCSHDVNPEAVLIRVEEIGRWGKSLFAIAKEGKQWARVDYDLERYNQVIDVSGKMKEFWDHQEGLIAVPEGDLDSWSNILTDISSKGLEFSDDKYDIRRYSTILEISDEMHMETKSYSSDIRSKREKVEDTGVRFLADREIAPLLIGMIDKADKRVLIASPWIKGIAEIEEKLAEVKEDRNVLVKVLVRKSESDKKTWTETLRGLHKLGFHIEAADYLHAKMLLVDDKELYIGSANLLETSLDRNLEAGIWTTDEKAVEDAVLYFQSAFDEAFEKRG
ncbi:MAG: NUDIX hydrolase N-terminal domain-containing protein [Candidatus Thorarchaeota archaeon]